MRLGRDVEGGLVALNDFSLTIPESPPAITAIVGESGSGKTTLASMLLGVADPTTGEVRYRGTKVVTVSRPGPSRVRFTKAAEACSQATATPASTSPV